MTVVVGDRLRLGGCQAEEWVSAEDEE